MARPASATLEDFDPALADLLVDQSLRTIAKGADRTVWWRCVNHLDNPKHVYPARVYNKTNAKHPTKCPICSGRLTVAGINDVATTHPEVAELFVDKTAPTTVTAQSNKKFQFHCGNPDHDPWTAPVSRLTRQGSRCPQCSGRVAVKSTDCLAITHPELARQLADPALGFTLKAGSNKKVTWICPVNSNHRWEAEPTGRIRQGSNCPYCSGRQATPGVNDLATTHPYLADQLVNRHQAITLKAGSDKKVLWQCPAHPQHTWRATVSNRVNKHTGCAICHADGVSSAEAEIVTVIKKLCGDTTPILTHDRKICNGKELDIVLPDQRIAIEYNGVFWHSDGTKKPKANNYHADKTHLATEQGYQLIHIWEDDWRYRQNVVIKTLAHKLHATRHLDRVIPDIDKIDITTHYARTLQPCVINHARAHKFLETHHIQGAITATSHLGLMTSDNQLVAVLSIRSPRQNARAKRKNGQWEIQRYATAGNVPGGFTKLLKFAEKQRTEITSWITFAACDISQGGLYEKAGFVQDKVLAPDYKYVGSKTGWKRTPKEKFQKKTFRNRDDLIYCEGWTERQAAKANKLYRIYDAGKVRWVKDV